MFDVNSATPSPADKPLRLFYALWPDEATREALLTLQMQQHGRRTRAGNLHATLAFLGEQAPSHVALLEDILADLPHDPITLHIDRIGYFKRKRIVWAGSHAAPDALVNLQQSLGQSLVENGIEFDRKNDFTPHITLARDAEPPEDRPFETFTWEVQHVALVQSLQESGRLDYKVLASLYLDKPP